VGTLVEAIGNFESGGMAVGDKLGDEEFHMYEAGSLEMLEARCNPGLGRPVAPQLLVRIQAAMADTG
jgi:hypothetical protein